jgi:hypothetical protein
MKENGKHVVSAYKYVKMTKLKKSIDIFTMCY